MYWHVWNMRYQSLIAIDVCFLHPSKYWGLISRIVEISKDPCIRILCDLSCRIGCHVGFILSRNFHDTVLSVLCSTVFFASEYCDPCKMALLDRTLQRCSEWGTILKLMIKKSGWHGTSVISPELLTMRYFETKIRLAFVVHYHTALCILYFLFELLRFGTHVSYLMDLSKE